MRIWITTLTVLALSAIAPRASAQEEETSRIDSAFSRPVAIGAYAIGWAGSYAGGGVGGRLRWEMFPELGVEVFGEALIVENGGGLRHDHPVGFDLFVPVRIAPWLRFRPLFGFCAVFSLIEPAQEHAPRADDILFGVHAGAGLEIAFGTMVSVFADLQANVWMGHDRASAAWTAGIEDSYAPFATAQLAIGVQLHLGD